jgi:hypothetical protein
MPDAGSRIGGRAGIITLANDVKKTLLDQRKAFATMAPPTLNQSAGTRTKELFP